MMYFLPVMSAFEYQCHIIIICKMLGPQGKDQQMQYLQVESICEAQQHRTYHNHLRQLKIYEDLNIRLRQILDQLMHDMKQEKNKWEKSISQLQQDVRIKQALNESLLKINKKLLHQNSKLKEKISKQTGIYQQKLIEIETRGIQERANLYSRIIELETRLRCSEECEKISERSSNRTDHTEIHQNPEFSENGGLMTDKKKTDSFSNFLEAGSNFKQAKLKYAGVRVSAILAQRNRQQAECSSSSKQHSNSVFNSQNEQ